MKRTLLLINICLLSLSACTTISTVCYDRLQSAEVCFPDEVRRVGVINNVIPSKLVSNEAVNVLDGDGDIMAEAFAQAVAETKYFDQVIISDSMGRERTSQNIEKGFSFNEIDNLIRSLDVDLLFSIDNLYVQLKDNSYVVPGVMTPIPIVDGIVTPIIRAYVHGRSAPLFVVNKSDSIYWEITPSLDIQQIIKESSEFAASIPMRHLLPYWEEVNRYIFSGGCVEMRDANVYVQENNWGMASELWEEIYNHKKGKTKMQAAYNLAVYYEMQNDFDMATKYLDEALGLSKENSSEKQMMEIFQIQLKTQLIKNQKLKMQLQRFDDIF